jgi:hypothetical protein
MTIGRALLVVLAGCLIWIAVDQARLVSPTTETESAFLKTYTPNKVTDRFKVPTFSEESTVTSGGAGRGFATHGEEFELTLVINTGDWVALMQALRDDIAFRLAAQSGEIVEESGTAVDGFKIKYAVGKSEGRVAVEQLKSVPASSLGDVGPGPDNVTVSLHISINEKWFKEVKAKRKRTSSYDPRFEGAKLPNGVFRRVQAALLPNGVVGSEG